MKKLFILFAVLFLTACTLPDNAITNTPAVTDTPTVTLTAVNPPITATTTTAAPSATPSASVTPTEPVLSEELLINGALIVDPNVFPQDGLGGTYRCADGWICDANPAPPLNLCKEGQTVDCNLLKDLKDFKPEFKPSDFVKWVFPFALDDTGQQWFCWNRVCDVALGQTVRVQEGAKCEAVFTMLDYQQVDGHFYDKESIPPDVSGLNSVWRLNITQGNDRPWDGGAIVLSTKYYLDDEWHVNPLSWSIQDQVISVRSEFIAPSDTVTLWIRNTRGYPVQHQESIVYDASLKCWVTPDNPLPTIEPAYTPTPVVPVTPTETDCTNIEGGWYAPDNRPSWMVIESVGMKIRTCPLATSSTLTGASVPYGGEITAVREYNPAEGTKWLGFECPYADLCWIAAYYDFVSYGVWSDVAVSQ